MPSADPRLQALFKQPQALPSAPEVAARLIGTFGQVQQTLGGAVGKVDPPRRVQPDHPGGDEEQGLGAIALAGADFAGAEVRVNMSTVTGEPLPKARSPEAARLTVAGRGPVSCAGQSS